MSAYLGPIGGLISVAQFRGSQDTKVERTFTEKRLLSGATRVQMTPRPSRSWNCAVPHSRLQHHAALKAYVYGGWEQPPLFVPVDAPYSNVMTPQRSQPGRAGGWAGDGVPETGMQVPGIGPVTGLRSAGGLVTLGGFSTPVMPGRPMTGSVWCSTVGGGAVRLVLTVFSASRAVVSTQTVTRNLGLTMERLSVSAPPSSSGAYAQLQVRGANAIACAACTWTADVRPWVPGVLAGAVFISGWSSELKTLDVNQREPVESLSFEVMEVGDA